MGKLTFALGIVNGAIGDYLARTGNELAFDMALFSEGRPLSLDRESLKSAHPDASSRIVVLLHGLMNTEEIFRADGAEDYGARLHAAFGVTPYYVRYNSGLPIPENGAAFAKLLDALIVAHAAAHGGPVTDITLLGYSMGGLVARSACHVAADASLAWLPLVRRAIYVGTPHRGAPLERAGRVLVKVLRAIPDPVTRLVADIANMRSDGIKDLGDADLTEESRSAREVRFSLRDARHPVPLLPAVSHLLVCGSVARDPDLAVWFGDALVPIASASFDAVKDAAELAIPPEHVKHVPGLHHVALPSNPEVWEHIRAFYAASEHDASLE